MGIIYKPFYIRNFHEFSWKPFLQQTTNQFQQGWNGKSGEGTSISRCFFCSLLFTNPYKDNDTKIMRQSKPWFHFGIIIVSINPYHPNITFSKCLLVGGWTNPFEQYARQIGSFPQVRVKIKHVWNHLAFVELTNIPHFGCTFSSLSFHCWVHPEKINFECLFIFCRTFFPPPPQKKKRY